MKPLHELDALCAERVAGWTNIQYHEPLEPSMGSFYTGWNPGSCRREDIIPYTTDPAAVLGLLEKHFLAFQWNPGDRCFSYLLPRHSKWEGAFGSIPLEDGAFALAATLALLKAHGVETE